MEQQEENPPVTTTDQNLSENMVINGALSHSRKSEMILIFGLFLIIVASAVSYFFFSKNFLSQKADTVIPKQEEISNQPVDTDELILKKETDSRLNQRASISGNGEFLIHAPTDWRVIEEGYWGASMVMTNEGVSSSSPVSIAIIAYETGSSSLEEYVETLKKIYYEGTAKYEYDVTLEKATRGKRISPEYDPSLSQIKIVKELVLGGKEAYLLNGTVFFSSEEFDPNYTSEHFLVLDGKGKGYGIIVEGVADSLRKNADLIDSIVASFRMIDDTFPEQFVHPDRTVWSTQKVTVTAPSKLFQFEYEFASPPGSEGFLSIKFDDELVFVADELYGDDKLGTSTIVSLSKVYPPGEYELRTRLDPHFEGKSKIIINNMRFAY